MRPKFSVSWMWAVIAILAWFLTMAIPYGASVYYTASYAKHACDALSLLVSIPAPKPADAAANPSRELNYKFHEDLESWFHSDRCG